MDRDGTVISEIKIFFQNSIYFPNEEQRPKFDIYSFGVIALEMLMPKEIADSEKNKHQVGHEIARIGKHLEKTHPTLLKILPEGI